MSEVATYFDQLKISLEQEQTFDRSQYQETLSRASTSERRNRGISWYPISIVDSEIGMGDYLTIHIQRNSFLEEPHQFRFGMPVSLFSNLNSETDRIQGTIAFVNQKLMKISFRLDELPDWSRNGKLGVDLLFDENSYKEMFSALNQATKVTHPLIKLLSGQLALPPTADSVQTSFPDLNPYQNKAISEILQSSDISIVHGPPGTGKTTTLVQAIAALWKQEQQQLLVVAPSNTAVDLLTERLDELGLQVLRIGNPVKVSAHLQELTLDGKIALQPEIKDIKKLKKQAAAYTDMAHKYKRSFGKAEREQRKALFTEARRVIAQVEQIQDFLIKKVLDQAQVITATCVGANHFQVKNRQYHTVFIDEAGQALEPACWIPILKGERLVLAGDHMQLPPTIKSPGSDAQKLSKTLLEKLVEKYPSRVILLQEQYRMHEEIMKFPSQEFYHNKLLAHPGISERQALIDGAAFQFIDCAGTGFEETVVETAIYNEEEAQFAIEYLVQICLKMDAKQDFPSIGLISPYRKQVQYLQTLVQERAELQPYLSAIQVNTIDSFQGQEKDIIIISLTRANDRQEIGFLAELRRMNVAITRAKQHVILIGDSSTISKNSFYSDMIQYAEQQQGYHSIWEYQ